MLNTNFITENKVNSMSVKIMNMSITGGILRINIHEQYTEMGNDFPSFPHVLDADV